METNWLDLAKQITEPLKCRWCGCLIGLESSYPTGGQFINGELLGQQEMCWNCAQQDAD